MFDVEKSIAEATEEFKRVVDYVRKEGPSHDAYTVERSVLARLLRLGRFLMAAYFEEKEGGDVGPAIELESGEQLPRERLKDRDYLTVFGEMELPRCYYHKDGGPGVFPLDAATNLPEAYYSYFVQELVEQRLGRMTYEETVSELEGLFALPLRKHTVKDLAPPIAADADPFYAALGTPPPETEAEILVAAVDGKGVPIVKDEPAEHKVRLGKGEKLGRKKEAVVAAVYTIKPHVRTAEDIVREVRDKGPVPQRPRPQNKHVRATLQGKEDAFEAVRAEVEHRDPRGEKKRACLMDGSRPLWALALVVLKGFTFILDLFHALEYLWKAAYVFHAETSPEAEQFVRERLLDLLRGKVGYVIGGLRQMLTKHRRRLNASQRKTLETVIGYYERNRRYMRYDEYITAGYPIGSGAVESACRHLVKDRMEGSGMRWTVPGAEAVLKLRAVYLNGDWDPFWQFHMRQEAARRFGQRRWAPLAQPEAPKQVA